MSKKILFQSLLKFRDQIKDGTAKVQDIITDYFNQTGKSVTEEERAIILNFLPQFFIIIPGLIVLYFTK